MVSRGMRVRVSSRERRAMRGRRLLLLGCRGMERMHWCRRSARGAQAAGGTERRRASRRRYKRERVVLRAEDASNAAPGMSPHLARTGQRGGRSPPAGGDLDRRRRSGLVYGAEPAHGPGREGRVDTGQTGAARSIVGRHARPLLLLLLRPQWRRGIEDCADIQRPTPRSGNRTPHDGRRPGCLRGL